MRVISIKKLRDFWAKHGKSKGPLTAWHTIVSKEQFENFEDVKTVFRSADRVEQFTIFDIGGNNFRVVTAIHYNRGIVFIRGVFTHPEYDKWNRRRRR
jgi:mRNA interferase HigB